LFLKYANGTIEITAIKPNGKRQMSGKDFVNGMQTEELQLFS
jgi:methionyl-tRNA formyltransferase